MANAAIVISNLADSGTWSASSAETLMPVSRLAGEHVSERWRSTAEPAYVICDLGSEMSIDTVALFGMTAGAGASVRVRASTSDAAAESSLDFDSGAIDDGDPEFDAYYGSLVYRRSAPGTTRYVRIDITDTPASYVEAGVGLIGLSEAFDYNFVSGGSTGWEDRSRRAKTAGGQTLIFHDNKVRSAELNFDFVPEDQRNGLWETMARVNGNSVPVLLMLDTASGNMPRDSIFGLVTSPHRRLYTAIPDIFTAPLSIEERL